MARDRSEEISRRNFLGVTIGTALVAGVGCSSEAKTEEGSTGGQRDESGGASGQGGRSATGESGSSAAGQGQGQGGASTGQGGTSSSSTLASGKGGTTAGSGGASTTGTDGTSESGGSSNGGGASGTSGKGGSKNKGGSTGEDTGSGGSTAPTSSTASGGASAEGGTPQGTPLVAMVRGTDWVQATMDAIALAGGLPDLSGKTVLLKPNIISSDKNATTSVDVIHGCVKAAKAKNAKKIIVADAGWGTGSDVIANMKALGITAMCTAEGAETLDLRSDKHTTRTHANASAFPSGVDFSDSVYNADYVINVPVCKSHGMGKFSMALKAWYGCTETGRPHGNTWVAPAELHLFRQEEFVVLDATKAMITGGPSSGTMAQSKIVAASRDAIALDITGLCIHKHNGGTVLSAKGDAWKIHQIKRALALKFPGWVSSPQAFSYAQEGVSEHAEIMGWLMA